jgi:ABC-type transport system involved in cytochrome bd biosynthesis fused ATPase/permease subunit
VLAAAEDRTVLLITHRPEGLDLVDEVVRLMDVWAASTLAAHKGRAL